MTEAREHATILVTGATGTQGGAVLRELLDRGHDVRAVTRNPEQPAARELAELGAEVLYGDLDDPESLDPGLKGAHGVFSVQDFWEHGYEREVRQGVELADRAREAGVEHFVYSSVGSAYRETDIAHFESKWEVEQHVRDVGFAYTILRPVFFMENWEQEPLRGMVLSGEIVWPLSPETRLQQVSVEDLGHFAAEAFEDPEAWNGRELDLAGDELRMTEMAEIFSEVTGRDVEYRQIDWEDYREAAGDEFADMYRWFEDQGYEADIDELRAMHPGLTDLETYLRDHGWEDAG